MFKFDLDICRFCLIAFEGIKSECGHPVCRSCLKKCFLATKIYPIRCLFCFQPLQDKECEENLGTELYEILKEVKVHTICANDPNKHQCQKPGCLGIFDSEGSPIDSFVCAECGQKTCLKCAATHTLEETCDDWKANNKEVMQNRRFMVKENKLQRKCGHGMDCPQCNMFIQKIQGCDSLMCPNCRILLCFKTKQLRWGPQGFGDLSGGCKCLSDSMTLCHPRCKGCTIFI